MHTRMNLHKTTALVATAIALISVTAIAQTPNTPAAPSPPYQEQEVTFTNGPVTLAGTVTIPSGKGPFPAVVLVTGSGPQNRNEELFGFKPFQVLADHLGRQGFVVLRYDDRGVGGSTGSVPASTTEDFAGDALAALALLRARNDVRAGQVGIFGHSEGAIVAAITASRSPDVAFIVMLAGSSLRGDEILRGQAADLAKAGGVDAAGIARIVTEHRRLTEALAAKAPDEEIRNAIRALARAQMGALPEAQRQMLGNVDALIDKQMNQQVAGLTSAWMRFFIGFDPATALARVTCPVLAIFGELDLQVPPAANRAALEAALARAGNRHVTVKVYPAANHLFQTAKTGHPSEYAMLEKRFVPGLLDDVSTWLAATCDAKNCD